MAEEQIVTNIVAKSDFSNLISDLNRVSAALTNLKTKLEADNKMLAAQANVINNKFAETLRSTGQFSTHFVSLSSDIQAFGTQLDKGQLKLGQYFNTYKQHIQTSGGLIRQLAQQQVQLQNAVLQPLGKNAQGLMQYNVNIPAGLDKVKNATALANQELQIMNKVMQQGANQLINWGKNTQWAGRQLTVGLAVPMIAFGTAAANAFKTADEQLVRLTKVYGGIAPVSSAELAKVRKDVAKTANELAKAYGSSYTDTIALAADIAATGKQGNELLGSLKETTRLSVLGEVDRQTAMKTTLALQNTFKMNTQQLADSINFLNGVENQTSTTLQDLTDAIPKAGPVFKGLGGDVKDLALMLVAMKEGGIDATQGANALKSAMASLINPTTKAVNMFKSFGVDLKGIVTQDSGHVTQMILDIQSALDKLNPMQKQQAIEQLFGKFQFARMAALFDNLGRQGSQTLQVLDLIKASSGDLANIASREIGQVTESASGKYRRAVEGLKADLAGVGNQFLTINTHLINFVDNVIKFINKLPDPIKKALGFLGMLTAVAGPLIMLTGVLGNFFGYIIKGAFHLKSLFKGGEGWKFLTPEILAAQKAGNLVEQTFYSDAKAAAILEAAINSLSASFTNLEQKASLASISTNPTVSTTAGNAFINANVPRVVNASSMFLGDINSRDFSHHNPTAGKTQTERLQETIHSVTPGTEPINKRIGANPQLFALGDMPSVPGLTRVNGVSTGIVAGEAAKWHAMMGTLSMLSQREVADLKKEISQTGTFSEEISQTFGQLLVPMTEITTNAATKAAAIVAELQQGTITMEAAKAQIIALNTEIETMMAQATTSLATNLGKTANLTAVPLINQPIVNAQGRSNIKELFRPGRPTSTALETIAKTLGVRTWGGGYSTETTMPKRLNSGGKVYNPIKDGNIVPGDTSINYDNTPAMLQSGGFILNQRASQNNPDLVNLAKNGYASGGEVVPALLTPGETYFPPVLAQQMMSTLEVANSGKRVQLHALGGRVTSSKNNYGLLGWQNELKYGANLKRLKNLVPGFKPRNAQVGDVWYLKPFTGLFAKGSGNINDLMKSGSQGAPIEDFIQSLARYTRGNKALLGGRRSIYGSTDSFLSAIPNKLIPVSQREALALQIENAYLAKLREMQNRGLLITDANNPYHTISNKIISDFIKTNQNKTLGKLWKQFKVATSSIDKYTGTSRGASTSPQGVTLDADGYLISIGAHEGNKNTDVRFLHSANKDWQKYIGKNAGGVIGGRVLKYKHNYGIMNSNAFMAKNPQIYGRVLNGGISPEDFVSWIKKGVSPSLQKDLRNTFAQYPNGEMPVTYSPTKNMGRFPMPASYYQDLANTNPLHGPLQIGKYRGAVSVRSQHVAPKVVYSGLNNYMKQTSSPAFEIGTIESRAKNALFNYMQGDYAAIDDPAVQTYLSTIRTKFTGRLHRGIRNINSLPPVIADLVRAGKWDQLVGKEFIMRRSSWSTNKDTAEGFGQLQLVANVKNRNAVPASQIFPDLTFQTASGPVHVNESEVYMGGKFKVVRASKDQLQLQAVYDAARAAGGPVNANRPYLVGENGPEIFVPRNSGGIIPNYVKGGKISYWDAFKQGKQNELTRQRLKNSGEVNPNAYQGSMAAGLGLQVAGGLTGGITGNAMMIAGTVAQFAPLLGGITRSMKGVGSLTGLFTKFGAIATRVISGIRAALVFMTGPIGLAITAVAALVAGFVIWRKHVDGIKKAHELAFGGTQKSFASVGINNYKSLSDRLKDVNAQMALNKAKAEALYNTYTKGGPTGITLTISQLNDAISNAKKNQGDYVDMFNKIKGTEVNKYAADLKAQFVAMGMSASQASNQIYAIIKASDKASYALQAVTTQDFSKVTDQISGLTRLFDNLGKAAGAKTFDSKNFATGIDTLLNSVMAYEQALIGTKDATGKFLDENQALQTTMEKIHGIKSSDTKLNADTLQKLKDQNVVYSGILGNAETLESVTAKILMYNSQLGSFLNLGAMSASQAVSTAQAYATVAEGVSKIAHDTSSKNPLSSLATSIDKGKKAIAGFDKTVKQAQQLDANYYQNKIDAINKVIDGINKEAEARKAALQATQDAADTELAIKKKQLEYQDALAAGDMQKAAQAQLDIQQLVKQKETKEAIAAIDAKQKNDVAKQQANIDAVKQAEKNMNTGLAAAQNNGATTQTNVSELEGVLTSIEQLSIQYKAFQSQSTDKTKTAMQRADAQAQMNDVAKQLAVVIQDMKASKNKDIVAQYNALVKQYGGKTPLQTATGLAGGMSTAISQSSATDSVFKTAVDKFMDAVIKFSGQSNAFRAPEKGEYTARGAMGYDTTYMLFTNASGKKYEVKVDSKNYENAYTAGVGKGWTWQGYAAKGATGYSLVPGSDGNSDWNKLPKAAMGGYITHYGPGGGVFGPGTGTSDSIPAMLSNGEYVVRASAVKAVGTPMLNQINKMATGGLAVRYDIPTKSVMGYSGGGNVNGTIGSHLSVGEINMHFAETPSDGRKLFAEFKEALRVENIKVGNSKTIGGR